MRILLIPLLLAAIFCHLGAQELFGVLGSASFSTPSRSTEAAGSAEQQSTAPTPDPAEDTTTKSVSARQLYSMDAPTTQQAHLSMATDIPSSSGELTGFKCAPSACEEFVPGQRDDDCCAFPWMAGCAPGHLYTEGRLGCGHGYDNGAYSTCCIPKAHYDQNQGMFCNRLKECVFKEKAAAGGETVDPSQTWKEDGDGGSEEPGDNDVSAEETPFRWNENDEYERQGYNPPDDIAANTEKCILAACQEYEPGRLDTDCCAHPEVAFCGNALTYAPGAEGCGWDLRQGQRSTCCYDPNIWSEGDITATQEAPAANNVGERLPNHHSPPDDITADPNCHIEACQEYEIGTPDSDCCAFEGFCASGFRYEPRAAGCGWGLEEGAFSTCCIRDEQGTGSANTGASTSQQSSRGSSSSSMTASVRSGDFTASSDSAVPIARTAPMLSNAELMARYNAWAAANGGNIAETETQPPGPEDHFYKRLSAAPGSATWLIKADREGERAETEVVCELPACEEFVKGNSDSDCCAIPRMASCAIGHRYLPLIRNCGGKNDMGSRVTCCVKDDSGSFNTEKDTGRKWFDRVFGAGTAEPDFCIPGFPRPANPYTCAAQPASTGASSNSDNSYAFFDAEIIKANTTSEERLPKDVTGTALMTDQAYKNGKEAGLRNSVALAADLDVSMVQVKATGFHVVEREITGSRRKLSTTTPASAVQTVQTSFIVKSMDATNARVAASLTDRAATARIQAMTEEAMRTNQRSAGSDSVVRGAWQMESVRPVDVQGSCVTRANKDYCEVYSRTSFSDERGSRSQDEDGSSVLLLVCLLVAGGCLLAGCVFCYGGYGSCTRAFPWSRFGLFGNKNQASKVVNRYATTISPGDLQHAVSNIKPGVSRQQQKETHENLSEMRSSQAALPLAIMEMPSIGENGSAAAGADYPVGGEVAVEKVRKKGSGSAKKQQSRQRRVTSGDAALSDENLASLPNRSGIASTSRRTRTTTGPSMDTVSVSTVNTATTRASTTATASSTASLAIGASSGSATSYNRQVNSNMPPGRGPGRRS
ncbi:unnamed protein product [Amoebophrya sp. A120]|nr:unnamed protein product [Amoebophrya sp. A120]|eukprot:GSA120T00023247001.1